MNHRINSAFSASGASGLYDRARPSYPIQAIIRIIECLPSKRSEVVELGAGTGIFTRALLSQVHEGQIKQLTAIEPAAGMRSHFNKAVENWKSSTFSEKQETPEVRCLDGTFDNLEVLEDASADLVVAAQAWHWTGSDLPSHEKAMQEVSRVLKRGGHFALIWNLKDREVNSGVGRLRDLFEVYEAGTPQYRLGLWKYLFHTEVFKSSFDLIPPVEHSHSLEPTQGSLVKNVDDSIDGSIPTLTVRRNLPLSLEQFYDRIFSKSYLTDLDPPTKQDLQEKIGLVWNEFVLGNPEFIQVDEKTVEFPYVTHLYLMKKRAD